MTKIADKPTRANARVDALKRLMTTLECMPLNSNSKDFIITKWTATYDRFNSLTIKHSGKKRWAQAWKEMSHNDLFKEFNEVEKHFRYLNIFSKEFYSALSIRWDALLSTFNPNANWYKD